MRPIKLIMSAFGPYAAAVEVDFEKFSGSGVFLITGDTGAGKTTIFDGISYALYGEASGGRSRRAGKSFRSDYAALTDETFVEFTFAHRGRVYRIRRNPDYRRKKLRGEGTTVKSADAQFLCIDTEEMVSGQDAVAKRVKELIGLDQNQFSQTVMIAQGDFMKILNAGSDERKALFQKLFDTLDYDKIQKKLKEKNDESLSRLDEIKAVIQSQLDRIMIDEQFTEGDDLGTYIKDDKYIQQIIALMEKMVCGQKTSHKKALEICEDLKVQLENTEKELIRGESVNGDIEKLRSLKQDMDGLLKNQQQIAELESDLECAEKASALEYDEQLLIQSRNDIEADLSRMKEREEKRIRLEKMLPEYERILKDAMEAAAEEDKLKEKCRILREGEAVLSEYAEAVKKLSVASGEMEKLLADSRNKDEVYTRTKEKYYCSQSGLLAMEMKEGEACPVCGSIHHPHPAIPEGDVVTKEEVEAAEKERNDAETRLSNQEKTTSEYKAYRDSIRQRLDYLNIDENSDGAALLAEAEGLEAHIQKIIEDRDAAKEIYDSALIDLEKIRAAAEQLADSTAAKRKRRKELEDSFAAGLLSNGFAEEAQYHAAKRSEKERKAMNKKIRQYHENKVALDAQIGDYEEKTRDKQWTELGELKIAKNRTSAALETAALKERQQERMLNNNVEVLENLKKQHNSLEKHREKSAVILDLYQTVSGQKAGLYGKLTFEAYVQQYYFKEVIAAANKRLAMLTEGQFILRCKPQARNMRSQSGLDLDVMDRSTGKWRDVSTLSGGESFMTSLAMALGLSDVVQSQSGQIRLDSMFIDEGFGSLDENALHQAINLLSKLADGKRLIGVISHVSELKERIDRKIIVKKTVNGSLVEME